MKRSLGRAVLVWLILGAAVWGAAYRWSLLESPRTLRVGEAGVIRYECAFETSAADYTIDFKPQSTDSYKAEVLTQRDRVTSGKRIQTFDVLITPQKAGEIDVRLSALVRHTTFASIENATIGRDNVKRYDFNDETAHLPPVRIRVGENTADLTGTLTLEASVDKTMVRAYEPLHLSLYVRGAGNLEKFIPYELNITGVKVFAEAPQKNLTPSREGFEGEIRQEFALVAEESFVIPPFELKVFDTAQRQMKTIKTSPVRVEVGEGYEPQTLLDPPDLSDTATLKRYALYVALVVLGVVLSEAVRRLWKLRPRRRGKPFWDEAKTSKELAMLLALSGEKRYDPLIAALEAGRVTLREAKNKLSTLQTPNEVSK
ncbi:MAG: BatD family protein [Campylobacterales bacterium]|nr:BatD family protein [Campylobacterales bacterium]